MILLFQITHTVYFISRRFVPFGCPGTVATPAVVNFLQRKITDAKRAGKQIIITGVSATPAAYADLLGARGLLEGELVNWDRLSLPDQTLLLLVVNQEDVPAFNQFISLKGVNLEKKIGNTCIYIYAQM